MCTFLFFEIEPVLEIFKIPGIQPAPRSNETVTESLDADFVAERRPIEIQGRREAIVTIVGSRRIRKKALVHWPRTKIRPFIFPLVVPLASYEKWTGSNRVWYLNGVSNGGAKNRDVGDVSRSRAKVINYTGYLTPNDRLASRMLTSRHHATCYARVPPADALNARNADFSLRIN